MGCTRILLAAACLGSLTACAEAAEAEASASVSQSYESFYQTYRASASSGEDSVSYTERQRLWQERVSKVRAHNARNLSWRETVNRFSDYTPQELSAMLGYKPGAKLGRFQSSFRGTSSFLQSHVSEVNIKIHEHDNINISALKSEVDYRSELKASSFIRDQGACGSCWAVAATGALELYAEKVTGNTARLSHQQMVDCVPNPKKCGGTGGCAGATGELAFQWVSENGLATEDGYKSSKSCNPSSFSSPIQVSSFVRLPENNVEHLLHAVASSGPVVVSVDGSPWYEYSSGVYSGCGRNTVVNHAVVAMGYGKDKEHHTQKDYWLVRNSWSQHWGEKGFIRVERHMGQDKYCGRDNKPLEGVYCDQPGTPKEVEVCGMCGITSDSSFPTVKSFSSISAAAAEGAPGNKLSAETPVAMPL